MSLISKLQPLIILCTALVGLALGKFSIIGNISSFLIEVFLMILLYILFITVDFKQLKHSFKNLRYTITSLVINFIITPIIAYVLGVIFFPDSTEIRIGLLMLLVTPCTDWYLVFTGLSKGNVPLNISILPINLILQIVLLPVYLLICFESQIPMNVFSLLQSVIFVLIIPFALAFLTKKIIKNKAKVKEWIGEKSDDLQLLFLCLAIFVMFASQGSSLFENLDLLLKLFVPLILFFALLFVIAQVAGRIMKFEKRDIIALNFTTLARNSPLSLAIAVATFPDYPLVALALVIGPLIELPILSVISSILLKWNMQDDIV